MSSQDNIGGYFTLLPLSRIYQLFFYALSLVIHDHRFESFKLSVFILRDLTSFYSRNLQTRLINLTNYPLNYWQNLIKVICYDISTNFSPLIWALSLISTQHATTSYQKQTQSFMILFPILT